MGRAARLRTPLSARAPSILRIQLTIALSFVPSSHLSCCCCCCSRRHRVRVSAHTQGANEDRQANERDRGGGRPGWIWTMNADSLCLCCHLCGGTQQHPSPTRPPSIVSFTTAQWARLRVRILCARAPALTSAPCHRFRAHIKGRDSRHNSTPSSPPPCAHPPQDHPHPSPSSPSSSSQQQWDQRAPMAVTVVPMAERATRPE